MEQEATDQNENISFFKQLESRTERESMGINGMVLSMTELDSVKHRKTIYEFNELGDIASQTIYFSNGQAYEGSDHETEKWEFDNHGLPVSCEVSYKGEVAHIYTCSYDFLTREKTTSYYASDHSFLSTTVYKYDVQGNIISTVEENVMGSRTRDEFQYNDRNLKVSELRIDENQADTLLNLRYEYDYNAEQNWTKRLVISYTDTAYFLRTYLYQ